MNVIFFLVHCYLLNVNAAGVRGGLTLNPSPTPLPGHVRVTPSHNPALVGTPAVGVTLTRTKTTFTII